MPVGNRVQTRISWSVRIWIYIVTVSAWPGLDAAANMAYSQSTGDRDVALEEIVVTATKREESIQDVPISISALSAEDIENYGLKNLRDIGFSLPNFQWSRLTHLSNGVSIRGINSSDESIGFEPGVAVIVDDVFVGRAASYGTALLDIDRIEVLRGPQGTLQGRNVIGGAINITTARPSDEFHGKAQVRYGNYNALDFRGMLTGPLADNLSGRISVVRQDHEGYAYNEHLNEDLDSQKSDAIRAQLRYTPSDTTEVLLTGELYRDIGNPLNSDNGNSGLPAPEPDLKDRRTTRDFQNFDKRDVRALSANVYHDMANGMRFISVSSWRSYDVYQLQDVDEEINIGFGLSGDVLTASFDQKQSQLSQEFRLESGTDQRISWLAGAYYFSEELSEVFPFLYGTNNGSVLENAGNTISDSKTETDSYALFGSATFKLSDSTRLTAGLRYTDNRRNVHVVEIFGIDGVLPSGATYIDMLSLSDPVPLDLNDMQVVGDTRKSAHDKEFTGDITLWHDFSDDVGVYAKYARGFKGSGFNTNYDDGFAGGAVEPEFVDSYEFGLRSLLLSRRLRLNATAFYLEHTNQQVVVFEFGCFCNIATNEPSTESRGLELELQALVTENFRTSLAFGYIDAEFTKGPNKGNTPAQTPKYSVSGTLDLSLPVRNDKEFYFFGEASYRDTYYSTNDNLPFEEQNPFLLNARMGIRSSDGKWSVGLYGRNLSNETVFAYLGDFPPTLSVGWLTEPRTYGVEALFDF